MNYFKERWLKGQGRAVRTFRTFVSIAPVILATVSRAAPQEVNLRFLQDVQYAYQQEQSKARVPGTNSERNEILNGLRKKENTGRGDWI